MSYPLKHVVNKYHVVRHTEKNALTWCISMYHVIDLKQTCDIKNVTLEGGKKFVGVAVY